MRTNEINTLDQSHECKRQARQSTLLRGRSHDPKPLLEPKWLKLGDDDDHDDVVGDDDDDDDDVCFCFFSIPVICLAAESWCNLRPH